MDSPQKSVEVALVGGVGNQLFGYVAGLYYSLRHDKKLVLDVSKINKSFAESGSSILNFKLRDSVEIRDNKSRRLPFVRVLTKLKLLENTGSFTSTTNDFEELLDLDPGFEKIQGYFQNYKYLEHLRSVGLDLGLTLRDRSPSLENFMNRISGDRFITVHVRRGDYLKFSHIYKVLPPSYYAEAFRVLSLSDVKFDKVLVFSDDVYAAKQILGGTLENLDTIWMDAATGLNDVEMMCIMGMSEGSIIANSTYSYWGAILGNQDKKVVAPSEWFVSDPKLAEPALSRIFRKMFGKRASNSGKMSPQNSHSYLVPKNWVTIPA